MDEELTDICSLIDCWNSLSEFARAAGVTYGAAKQMRRRNSIAIGYWEALITSTVGRKISLSAERMVALHSKGRHADRTFEARAA